MYCTPFKLVMFLLVTLTAAPKDGLNLLVFLRCLNLLLLLLHLCVRDHFHPDFIPQLIPRYTPQRLTSLQTNTHMKSTDTRHCRYKITFNQCTVLYIQATTLDTLDTQYMYCTVHLSNESRHSRHYFLL